MLILAGGDKLVQQEIDAYKWRLNLHKEALLAAGDMSSYKEIVLKLQILNKYQKK